MSKRTSGEAETAHRITRLLTPFATVAVLVACGCRPTVAIVVDPALDAPTSTTRTQFRNDLHAAGYNVVETVSPFADPVAVRGFLQGLSERRLRGAILIGDIPKAYQYVEFIPANPALPATTEEVISYQFYSDLDGTFTATPGYVSPGGHAYSYDVHGGNVDWEIWVGVLPLYEGDYEATAVAINRYFTRNHLYRTTGTAIPRAFLEVNEHQSATTMAEHAALLADLQSGPYSWTPWSSAAGAEFFFDSPPAGLTVAQGYVALSSGVADFFHGAAHGSWAAHGQLDIPWAETNPIRTLFFWSDGCAVGDLDQPQNVLTTLLYSTTSEVLVAKGTTNNSGGLGTNTDGFFGHNIATGMEAGKGIGAALVDHVNVPLIWPWSTDREFHYATALLLGDPTLGVPP